MEDFSLRKIRAITIFLITILSAQMVNSQTIDRPSRSPSSVVRICASSDQAVFSIFSGYDTNDGYSSDTVFILLLSDTEGEFDNPTELGDIDIEVGAGDVDLEYPVDFSFLEEFSDNYRFQVVASSGGAIVAESSESVDFAIYYFGGIDDYFAEPRCGYEGVETTFTAQAISDYYQWYYEEDPGGVNYDGVPIDGANSAELIVSEVGRYYYEVMDFGGCFGTGADEKSNYVDINPGSATSDISITSDPSGSVCSEETVTFTGIVSNSELTFYEWYKDGVAIDNVSSSEFTVTGANELTLTVTGIEMEGTYRLDAQESAASDDCPIQSNTIDLELKNPKITITSETSVVLLPPGEPKTITAEVIRGDDPITITWFKDDVEQSSGTETEFEVTEAGVYTVRLTADSDCDVNEVFAEEEVTVVEPGNLNIVIAYQTDNYSDCEFDEVALEVTEITTTVNGETVTLDADSLGAIEVDWQKDGESTGNTDQSISINTASDNGNYTAVIGDDSSESLPVVLALDAFEIIKTPEVLELGETIELSLGIIDTDDYTFQWSKNFEEVTGETGETYIVDQAGNYSVQITYEGCGTETVRTTVTSGSAVIPNVITPNGDGINDDWVLTGDLTLNDEVEVSIYASNGELDYSTTGYDGEWPSESNSNAVGTIYYYVISRNNSPVEQGSITIIR